MRRALYALHPFERGGLALERQAARPTLAVPAALILVALLLLCRLGCQYHEFAHAGAHDADRARTIHQAAPGSVPD